MDENSKWYQGERLFDNLNLVLIFVIYTIIFFTMIFRWNIWWVLIGTGFCVMLYAIIYQSYTKKKQTEGAGQSIIEAWMDEVEDMGEKVILPIKKITPHDRLTTEEYNDAQKYIAEQKERLQLLELASTEDVHSLNHTSNKSLEDKSK